MRLNHVLAPGIVIFCFLYAPSKAENIVFPSDGGVIDITDPPYNAVPDDTTDDTEAIQAALAGYPSANKIIYLPNGTYRVSSTLRWPFGTNPGDREKRTILQGQSRKNTIIRLKENCPGFNSKNNPRPIIYTGDRPAQRFRNAVRNLTVSVGTGNNGAIGVQFNASNQGCIRDVAIVSQDLTGAIGLDMSYTAEIGPCLIKNVSIRGFDIGIKTGYLQNGVTFEHIHIEDQQEYGIYNERHSLSIRKLLSNNRVTAVYNALHSGHIVLIDSRLEGKENAQSVPAIINEATFFARNVATRGYRKAVENRAGHRRNVTGDSISEFVSHDIYTLFDSPSHSLGMDIKETPEVEWDDLSEWVSPTHFLDMSDTSIIRGEVDITSAVQQAADAGKSTLYFPNGSFRIDGTVIVGGTITRVIGLETRLYGSGGFKVVDGESPAVIFERLENKDNITVEQASGRRLVVAGSMINITGEGPGEIFIEDLVAAPLHFKNQTVWARQLNSEIDGAKIINDGGLLWILGLKTEMQGTIVETNNGGSTEILGGNIYPAYGAPPPPGQPAFINDNANVSISISECLYKTYYTTVVHEMRGDACEVLLKENLPVREAVEESPDSVDFHGAFVLPLYTGITKQAVPTLSGFNSHLPGKNFVPSLFVMTGRKGSLMSGLDCDFDIYNLKGQRMRGIRIIDSPISSARFKSLPAGVTIIKARH
ncbi:MAG: endopolygalacturonase [Chitinivibrionales bacterium]|nr:endopolygalacturonase [Chitinivibrionales bacterium]